MNILFYQNKLLEIFSEDIINKIQELLTLGLDNLRLTIFSLAFNISILLDHMNIKDTVMSCEYAAKVQWFLGFDLGN